MPWALVAGGLSLCGLGTAAAYIIIRRATEGILRASWPIVATADNEAQFFEIGAVTRGRSMSPDPITLEALRINSLHFRLEDRNPDEEQPDAEAPARRRILAARMTANMTLVDEASPYARRSQR
ncbi:hypothetical protein ACRAWG_01600 [Methylobacterium sp. P31]